jgi:dTDP-4-dehydrorhamnose reductase
MMLDYILILWMTQKYRDDTPPVVIKDQFASKSGAEMAAQQIIKAAEKNLAVTYVIVNRRLYE